MSEAQRKVAIVGKWTNVNSVDVTVTVASGPNINRFVLFGGASMACETCESSNVCTHGSNYPDFLCYDQVTDLCDTTNCDCITPTMEPTLSPTVNPTLEPTEGKIF